MKVELKWKCSADISNILHNTHTALNVINNVYLMVEEHLLTPTQYINIPYNQQIQMFQY